jgi:hypothetical protein
MTQALVKPHIRLPLNPLSHVDAVCLVQGNTPLIWRGIDLDIEVALYQGTTFIDSLTGIVKVICEIYPHNDRASAPYIQKEILVAAMDATCTSATWGDGTKEHATFTLTNSETNFNFATAVDNKKKFWMVFYAEMTGGIYVTLGGTTLTVEEDAANNDLPPMGSNFPMWRISPGNDLQLRNKTTGNYHSCWIDGPVGAERLVVASGST